MDFVQHWLKLSHKTCEDALVDSAALRRLAGIDLAVERATWRASARWHECVRGQRSPLH